MLTFSDRSDIISIVISKKTLTEKVQGDGFQRVAVRCDAIRTAHAGSFPSLSAESSKQMRSLTVIEFERYGP